METILMRDLKPSMYPLYSSFRAYANTVDLTAIYFLVIFSILVHGLSIPILSIIYQFLNVPPEIDPLGPAEVRRLSINTHLPPNSALEPRQRSILMYNRFSRTKFPANMGWHLPHFKSVHSDRDGPFPRIDSIQLGGGAGAGGNTTSGGGGAGAGSPHEMYPIHGL
jgi:hypothetical protein